MHRIIALTERALHLPKKKAMDLVFLSIYYLFVFWFVLSAEPGLIIGHLLYFIFPGLYLVVRYWRLNYHAFLFSITAGFLTGFPFQVMAELNNVWDYHLPFFDFFQVAGLRMLPIAWYVIWIGFTISAYSVFFDKHLHQIPKNHRFWKIHYRFLLVSAAVLAGCMFLLLSYPNAFIMQHPYLIFGTLIFVLPSLAILYLHPHLLKDVAKATIFFALFALVYELIGLQVGWWTYPGQYVASLPIFGLAVPIEEVVLWILVGSLWVLVTYEEVEHDSTFA